MSNLTPPRLKRAVQPPTAKAQGARIVAISVGGASPPPSKALPNAEGDAAPKKADPLAGVGLAAALGSRKAAPANVIKFERQPRTSLRAGALGVSRKAPSIVVGYGRSDTPDTIIEAFARAGAHEFRREAKTGRGVLRGIVSSLAKGDVLLLEKLTDLATPRDLPKAIQEIEARGITIRSLDGADSATPAGRGKIAKAVMASKALFPTLRL
jgi:hypothetical protein